jgi:hypothetical protein
MRGLVKLKNTLNRLNEIKKSLEWVKDKKDDFFDINTSRKTDGSVKTMVTKEEIFALFDLNNDYSIDKTDFKFFLKYFGSIFGVIGGLYTYITGIQIDTIKELNPFAYILILVICAIITFVIIVLTGKFNEKNVQINNYRKVVKDEMVEIETLKSKLSETESKTKMMENEKDFTIRIASAISEYNDCKVSQLEGMLMRVLDNSKKEDNLILKEGGIVLDPKLQRIGEN